MVETCDASPIPSAADEQWFNEAVAVMVITPIAIAIMLAVYEAVVPAYTYWRSCVAMNPAFPPSAVDFFLRGQCAHGQTNVRRNVLSVVPYVRCLVAAPAGQCTRSPQRPLVSDPQMSAGQTTSMPGHVRLTQTIPPDVLQLLDSAEEDIEVELTDRNRSLRLAPHTSAALRFPAAVTRQHLPPRENETVGNRKTVRRKPRGFDLCLIRFLLSCLSSDCCAGGGIRRHGEWRLTSRDHSHSPPRRSALRTGRCKDRRRQRPRRI